MAILINHISTYVADSRTARTDALAFDDAFSSVHHLARNSSHWCVYLSNETCLSSSRLMNTHPHTRAEIRCLHIAIRPPYRKSLIDSWRVRENKRVRLALFVYSTSQARWEHRRTNLDMIIPRPPKRYLSSSLDKLLSSSSLVNGSIRFDRQHGWLFGKRIRLSYLSSRQVRWWDDDQKRSRIDSRGLVIRSCSTRGLMIAVGERTTNEPN